MAQPNPRLFLAEIATHTTRYMSYEPAEVEGPFYRLVEAVSAEEAREKCKEKFKSDPYCTSVVANVEIHDTII